MNFYNPYLYSIPTTTASTGLLSRLNFSSILSGTTKALNFVNQAIPVASVTYYEKRKDYVSNYE